MPSKRHGYLTRKEWLRERLDDARDRASGADVDRFLRNNLSRFDYNVSVAGIPCEGYETRGPFVSSPHADCDCLRCRPWTT